MGLFDNIIGTSTEGVEPLGTDTISDNAEATGWTGITPENDTTSGGGTGGSGTGDDSSPVKTKKAKSTVDNETPNIDIGGDMNFSPESENIEEAAKSSFLDMSEPNNTIVENIVDITTPETAEPISIISVENNTEIIEASKTTETPEAIDVMPV